MTRFITILRRARTLLWTALSIVIISCAVVVGLGKLLMPYSAQYQPRLEAWLSSEFGHPVELDSFTGEWSAFGPQLAVKGMRLPAADGAPGEAVIEEAVIDIKPFNLLIPSRALYNFRVIGADFHLAHLADGSFEFSGLGVGGGRADSGAALKQLASISEVILEDSSLQYDDEVHGIHLDLEAVNGRLQVRGDELAAEIAFRLAHGAAGRISGELGATARLRLDGEQKLRSGRWQLSGQELMLGQLRDRLPSSDWFPHQGRLNAKLWGEWDRENRHRIRGVVDLRDARLAIAHLDRSVERLNTRLKWQFSTADEWRLDLSDFRLEEGTSKWSVSSLGLGRDLSAGVGLWLSADALPVATPVEVARDVMRIVGKDWPRYLPARGEGVVREFELMLDPRMKLASASGAFRGADVGDWHQWPDISNVDGRLQFGAGHGSLSLSGRGVVVEWPRMFAAPLIVDMPSCQVNFNWGGGKGRYQVALTECGIENEAVSAVGRMRFRGNEGKPAVDVMVHAERLDAGNAGDYWPRDLLKERVVDWLQRSLLAGELQNGRLQIHGDMDHWPFDQGEGRFEAVAEVRGADIAYFEGWPQAKGMDGTARFVNSGMDIQGSISDIGGVGVGEVRARIGDFRTPELRVDYRAQSDLPRLIGFLRRSPVNKRVGANLAQFVFRGPATTSGILTVPLREGAAGISLDGRLELRDNGFEAPGLDLGLTGIEGTLAYHQSGFEGEGLAVQYLGKPARLSIRAGSEAALAERGQDVGGLPASESGGRLTARLTGEFDVRDILPRTLLESWSPLARIQGSSQWQASLDIGPGKANAGGRAEFGLQSTLEGITVGLPAPLNKAGDAEWPFSLRLPLGDQARLLQLSLADRLSVKLALGQGGMSPHTAAVVFGPGEAELPAEGFLSLGGKAASIDLDGWIGLVIGQARQGRSLGGLTLESAAISAGEIHFLDRRFENVELFFSTMGAALNAGFEADTIAGNLSFTGAGGGSKSLSAEFERLVLDEPMTSGMEMEVDPSRLPALHLYAKSFRYGGVELGETRIEAYPTSAGFHFEKVEAESPSMSVRASGDWSLRNGAHRSSFDIHMVSESLGDFLRQLDIASPVEGGQTEVHFGVWWNGSPGQFRLARLNGVVNFSVNTGVISNASPGSGRLLGLLSVQSLPRRLALDFRDVFDSGFSFDEANGSFTMLNGSARTDDVTLTSSAANISFSGTTDLVGRQYNQLITVRPGIGNTLPVIGAIAGGPGGAAAGLALQGLLGDELGEASQVQYTLTGGWDEPLIEPVLKRRADG